ncbi:lipase family protein [soil metagenome]
MHPVDHHAGRRRRWSWGRLAAVAVALFLVVGFCTRDDRRAQREATTTTTTTTPTVSVPDFSGAGFYDPPDPLPDGEPGDVLRTEQLDLSASGDTTGVVGWRVLYLSTGLDGEPVAVSGLVYAPDGVEPPPGGFPVVSWGHGSTGVADSCAISRFGEALNLGGPPVVDMVRSGYVIAATDFEGLGTPGLHPYLVGVSEGRGVLDAARAAARLPETGAGARVVAWGFSQGGHAVLFAGELAAGYAPDLDLLGVVSGAPAADVGAILTAGTVVPEVFTFAFLGFTAWDDVYPDTELDEIFTDFVRDRLDLVEEFCVTQPELNEPFVGKQPADLFVADPASVDRWGELLDMNLAGTEVVSAPVLVVHGERDPLVPFRLSQDLFTRLCGTGTVVELSNYPFDDHVTVITAAQGEVLAWIGSRFAGEPPVDGCGG